MAQDMRRFIQGCSDCAVSKSPRHLPSGKLLPLTVPTRPWSHLGVDFITDLPPSNGNTCILVTVDRFSKSCCLLPLRNCRESIPTTRYFGIPEDIVSDRGPQFISRVWKAFFSLLNVTVSLSSGYHPLTNGQTERKIQEMGQFLRTFCHGHQNFWNQFLGWAEYAQNSLRQPSTGLTPFQCVLGYQPPLFPWSGRTIRSSIGRLLVPREREGLGRSSPPITKSFTQTQDDSRPQTFRKSHIPTRAKGLAVNPGHQVTHPLQKAQSQIHWPLFHHKADQPGHLQTPATSALPHTPHFSCVTPQASPSSCLCLHRSGTGWGAPPLPLILEDGTAYTVKEILCFRRRGGKLQYLVDWEGYGPEERSWEPKDNIIDPNLLETFHATHPEQPAPRGRGRPPWRRVFWPSGASRGGGGTDTEQPVPRSIQSHTNHHHLQVIPAISTQQS